MGSVVKGQLPQTPETPHGGLRTLPAYDDEVRVHERTKYSDGVMSTWTPRPVQKLGELCRGGPHAFKGQRIVFLETPPRSLGDAETQLSKAFGIRSSFFEELYHEANGYFAPHEIRSKGQLVRFDTEFRFLCKKFESEAKSERKTIEGISYQWEKLGFCTSWSADSLTVLCFDLPPALEKRIMVKLSEIDAADSSGTEPGPFDFHHVIVETMAFNFDKAVWQWQKWVRAIESMRPKDPTDRPNYLAMHELSRHITHNAEGINTAMVVIKEMQESLRRLRAREESRRDRQLAHCKQSSIGADDGLVKQLTIFNMAHNRSKALEDRLASEVTLVFHILQQWDSQNSYQIAKITAKDSRVMRTIAFLGLVFLPGTLISAIFSTSFFNFNPDAEGDDKWRVSDKFWVYWSITLPVTVFVVAIWLAWPYVVRLAHILVKRETPKPLTPQLSLDAVRRKIIEDRRAVQGP